MGEVRVVSLKDAGTTGNFEVKVNGKLVHSKKGGDMFLHNNPSQLAVVFQEIEAALG